MTYEQGIKLIQGAWYPEQPTAWMDLGCGNGFFTKALATRLPPGSIIHAWDVNALSLDTIPEKIDGVDIKKQACDFINTPLPEEGIEGILMANSLHYIPDQVTFLKKLRTVIRPGGVLLIIEYDRIQANSWVPYPVPFSKLESLANQAEWISIQKNGTAPSRYGAEIYAAFLQ
ncbi:MAG: class I SAM-dependent methyltransferase [Saprospiraceae bacterium]|nr:class I SAM-dependent methyltransferase [Saprospiraceae bacterium]